MGTSMIKKLLWLTFYSLPLIAFAANFTEPRAEAVSSQGAPNFSLAATSLPVKVTIHKGRPAQFAGLARVPAAPLKFRRLTAKNDKAACDPACFFVTET